MVRGGPPLQTRTHQEDCPHAPIPSAGLAEFLSHPITNAISEGFNSKIQAIKADARGFRRFENYRYRILFHCGKLDLLPVIR